MSRLINEILHHFRQTPFHYVSTPRPLSLILTLFGDAIKSGGAGFWTVELSPRVALHFNTKERGAGVPDDPRKYIINTRCCFLVQDFVNQQYWEGVLQPLLRVIVHAIQQIGFKYISYDFPLFPPTHGLKKTLHVGSRLSQSQKQVFQKR